MHHQINPSQPLMLGLHRKTIDQLLNIASLQLVFGLVPPHLLVPTHKESLVTLVDIAELPNPQLL